jgi:two-component sensor histidine kinase
LAGNPTMGTSTPSETSGTRRNRREWFLAGWTIFAAAVVVLLWFAGRNGVGEQVFVLHDENSPREAVWITARRNLLLAHLSLSRTYPWILLAPYVIRAATRFSLERERLLRHGFIQAALAAAFVAGCQVLNERVISGGPRRLIVSVTETSSRVTRTNGMPAGAVTTFRKEFRIAGSGIPDPAPTNLVFSRTGETTAETAAESGPFHPRVGAFAWQRDFAKPPESDMPFALFWRGRLPSVALDLFMFISLCGLGHAAHFHRRFQERERRAVALESSLARARLHTLQAQLQPHFLFNALNSITALVRQNPPAAEEMLTSLSDLLRLALSQANQPWSTVREELRFLRLYLDIQQMRFGERLQFRQEVDAAVLDCAVPTLLLQPLVENAIRHGIEPSGRTGTVRVAGRRSGSLMELIVEDDGVGCPALVDGTAHPGVGIANVRERLSAMFDSDAMLSFATGTAGGLAVCIRLPARAADSPAEPGTP